MNKGVNLHIHKKIIPLIFICALLFQYPAIAIDESTLPQVEQVEAQTVKVKQGSVLSLNDCIAIALNNSPEIKSAQYDYWITKTDVNIAKSQFFPTIGIGTGYDFTDTRVKSRN